MRFYILSPQLPLNPVLFPNMVDTFVAKGHSFVDRIEDCDAVLMDLHSRLAEYRQSDIDYLVSSRLPVAMFDEWDRGGLSKDEWPYPLTTQQESVWLYSHCVESVYFCRLLDKNKKYPFNLYPYEKPISYGEQLLTPDELFNRPYDICYIANAAPSRLAIAKALSEDSRLRCYIRICEPKIEFNEFVAQHKKGKLFISSAAGGFTDERVQCLFSIAGIVRQRTDQLLLHDFIHGMNCLKIDSPPTKKDLDDIYEIVNNKDALYDIYATGYWYMKVFYSKEYIAGDILGKIIKHL